MRFNINAALATIRAARTAKESGAPKAACAECGAPAKKSKQIATPERKAGGVDSSWTPEEARAELRRLGIYRSM